MLKASEWILPAPGLRSSCPGDRRRHWHDGIFPSPSLHRGSSRLGDKVVVKPTNLVLACGWILADILQRAGAPAGLFNLAVVGRTWSLVMQSSTRMPLRS